MTWETNGAGALTVVGIDSGDWPAHELRQRLAYKCVDAGVVYSETTTDASEAKARAQKSKLRKRARNLKRGIEATQEAIRAVDNVAAD